MRAVIFYLILAGCCIISLFLVGVFFCIFIEVFFYFYAGVEISFEFIYFRKIFKMSVWGGVLLGCGVTLFRLFKVKGF